MSGFAAFPASIRLPLSHPPSPLQAQPVNTAGQPGELPFKVDIALELPPVLDEASGGPVRQALDTITVCVD